MMETNKQTKKLPPRKQLLFEHVKQTDSPTSTLHLELAVGWPIHETANEAISFSSICCLQGYLTNKSPTFPVDNYMVGVAKQHTAKPHLN